MHVSAFWDACAIEMRGGGVDGRALWIVYIWCTCCLRPAVQLCKGLQISW